ncbi:hypothetical protein Tco_0997726, partial [Tanacetum coccineum]
LCGYCLEAACASGGSPAGIHGLFSGRYCGLASRMVTLRVSKARAKGVTTGTLGKGSTVPVESHHTPTGAPSTSQPHLSPTLRSFIRQETEVPQPSFPPHTNVVDEAASTGVDSCSFGDRLDADKESLWCCFYKSYQKVKRLEKKDKLSKSRRKLRLVLLDEEGLDSDLLDQDDPSKHGRKIAQIDEDKGITLVHMGVSTPSTDFTTTNLPVTTAGAEISTASLKVKTTSDSVDDIAAESLVYIKRSASKTKDKGKGIMEESESALTKTKRQQEQERLGYEASLRLQEQLDEEERQRIARAHKATNVKIKESLITF